MRPKSITAALRPTVARLPRWPETKGPGGWTPGKTGADHLGYVGTLPLRRRRDAGYLLAVEGDVRGVADDEHVPQAGTVRSGSTITRPARSAAMSSQRAASDAGPAAQSYGAGRNWLVADPDARIVAGGDRRAAETVRALFQIAMIKLMSRRIARFRDF